MTDHGTRSEPEVNDASARLYRSLLRGMHAMAQPLTLLHSRLYLALENDVDEKLCRQTLADAMADVDHLCSLFRLMQELLHVRDGVVAMTPLSLLLSSLDEDAEAIFAGSATTIKINASRVWPDVLVDAAAARQAILDMLLVARRASRAGSQVLCTAGLNGRWAELRVENNDGMEPLLDDCAELHLAVARANLESLGGALEIVEPPFQLLLCLPIAGARIGPVASHQQIRRSGDRGGKNQAAS